MTEKYEPPVQVLLPTVHKWAIKISNPPTEVGDITLQYFVTHQRVILQNLQSRLQNELLEIMPNSYLATNGPLATSARASPAPQGGPPVPNGKPTSPYNERQNPLTPNAQIAAQTVSSKDPKAAAQAASDMRNVVRRKLTGYVGFANLPNQWHRKSVRKGFNFNVMVVGT